MASIVGYRLFLLLLLTSQFYFTQATVTRYHAGKMARTTPKSDSHRSGPRVFIVYLGGVSTSTTNGHTDEHLDMLSEVLGSTEAAQDSIIYRYKHSFNGFAAVFSESEAESLREKDAVVSVFPARLKKRHTTLSWQYLGLSETGGLWPQTKFGSGVIVGVIDSGVWPEAKSFQDDGLSPIPTKWNGLCVTAEQFSPENCNRKLIGARYYYKGYETEYGPIESPEYLSPRDAGGHGSHTASTATGDQVPNASFFGLANGTASGGVPSARLAIYKVCWYYDGSCSDADILAAFDDAIADGVDLISVSLGSEALDYQLDSLAIGSFHAVDRGILVSCSAGNDGPDFSSVSNLAPWIFTVGASTLNRTFITTVQLGNGVAYNGTAINNYKMDSSYPLVYGGDIPATANLTVEAQTCEDGSLDAAQAAGKIVVCFESLNGSFADWTVYLVGGAGVIIIGAPSIDQYMVPATVLTTDQGNALLAYINSTSSPTARIDVSKTRFNSSFQITMADFSSRGPNSITADILKPDITAPGVNIIAAWSPVASPTGYFNDNRTADFNIISGTSMSCPHVTGAAALVKSLHPTWSPAAIKSAIMTTATPLRPATGRDSDLNSGLATGSGQIDPTRAADPGLVLNISTTNYVQFLCAIEYNSTAVELVTGKAATCPTVPDPVLNLNYPSIFLTSDVSIPQTAKRTLTNVGSPAQYDVTVVRPPGINVTVTPLSLAFTAVGQELSFTVLIGVSDDTVLLDYVFGSIVWSDGTHSVRIPIGVGPDYID